MMTHFLPKACYKRPDALGHTEARSMDGASPCVICVIRNIRTMPDPPGLWCDSPFKSRRGGFSQRFCGPRCRNAFWSALRRWGDRAIADGVLTIAEMKDGTAAACTLLQHGNPTWALPD